MEITGSTINCRNNAAANTGMNLLTVSVTVP